MTEYINDVVLGQVSPVATLHMSEVELSARIVWPTGIANPVVVWNDAYNYGDGVPVQVTTEEGTYIGATFEGGVILH